ncbi:MAG: hypothetical protein ACI959_000491 [Limisphaerales bacterium]|jgi:hypothetical protein
MKLFLSFFILSISVLICHAFYSNNSWGFFAHRQINKLAIFTIPESQLFGFYKKHSIWIQEHAVDADKRRYAIKEEAPRHYIDIDHYGQWPYPNIPRDWDSAVAKYSEDSLFAYGIGPWHAQRMYWRLTGAFKSGDLDYILRTSADLGHYLGDLHVPLHCTKNYNGQLTGQKGIHGFWESRLPELYSKHYNFFTGKASYISDVESAIWEIVLQSSAAVDSVLQFERKLEADWQRSKYSYEPRGEQVIRVYAQEYSNAYHQQLAGMVERRMTKSVIDLGSLWYSAWIDAGRPDLPGTLPDSVLSQDELEIEKKFKLGKILGRGHAH